MESRRSQAQEIRKLLKTRKTEAYMNVHIDQLPPQLRDIVLQNNPLVGLAPAALAAQGL